MKSLSVGAVVFLLWCNGARTAILGLSPLNLNSVESGVGYDDNFDNYTYPECHNGTERGLCTFSLSCMHSGGRSLGTCRNGFFIGSCCQMPEQDNPLKKFEDVCGLRKEEEPIFLVKSGTRIVGGRPSQFGAWPWQISLLADSRHICGAVLISDEWAITAAHCLHRYRGEPERIGLRLGEFDQKSTNEPEAHIDRTVLKMISHPDFDFRTYENDLALIKFSSPVEFSNNIGPICLPSQNERVHGRKGYVTGWGSFWEDGPLPSVLQEVEVPIYPHPKCTDMFKMAKNNQDITDVFICAGFEEGGKDACGGDSGGPLVIKSDANGRWKLAGITSWGTGCGERFQPGVYTRVPKYIKWIYNQMAEDGNEI